MQDATTRSELALLAAIRTYGYAYPSPVPPFSIRIANQLFPAGSLWPLIEAGLVAWQDDAYRPC